MSSFFEVPHQLLLVLSLALSGEASQPPSAPVRAAPAAYSAEGPLRFTDQIWLEAIKQGAGGEELAPLSSRIFKTSSGRYYVPAEAERQRIIDLKRDEDIASLVALDLSRRNAKALQDRLGRPPGAAELFLAHSVGLSEAADFLEAVKTTPDGETATTVPELGRRAPELLFHQGRPSRLREVLARIEAAVRLKRQPAVAASRAAAPSALGMAQAIKPGVAEAVTVKSGRTATAADAPAGWMTRVVKAE